MKVYLAAPYTSDNPKIVEYRVSMINKAAADLMKIGHIVFSPISHSHLIAMQESLPTTFDFWQKQNHAFIDWCDIVVVLCLPGRTASKGVNDEIRYADDILKPIMSMVDGKLINYHK